MTRQEAYIRASKYYLDAPLPEHWEQYDNDALDLFIHIHKWWGLFEDYSTKEVWELISKLASEFESL
mgnify:CR=1 FL=1